jgi:hypothetical protein
MIPDWFKKLQELFSAKGTQYYGDGGTIHSSTAVNVELDSNGKVVSVWFRCCPLPFTQTVVDDSRANSMRTMYQNAEIVGLHGVEIKPKK